MNNYSSIERAIEKEGLDHKKSFMNFYKIFFICEAVVFALSYFLRNINYKIFEPIMIILGLVFCFMLLSLGSYSVFKKPGDSKKRSVLNCLILPGSFIILIGLIILLTNI